MRLSVSVRSLSRRTLPFSVGHDQVAGRVEPHVEAGSFQMMANQARNIRVVLHYIDRRLHATIVAGKCCDFDTKNGALHI